mmetsp:Transcript_11195/g.18753  ORF Transcript_11195/g.18753 Transcript_11195/m.18753 type:complete len:393 (+) Transcript_11195:23-1201(+)|eukprot:CAMPEP_0119313524 /NCGR_PEP_ID=MMETSP1333-20130426/29376_1 /TAXON_ID=418940 /ORGANISM="Scyphosphaera apsteinii, Strain RCC1455" /LENGTH=392 /DNA_ID=CAMNT_0007318377 /DNA_START=23 /DNA_END=1201 /DNA_ORIENTATION=+
MADVNAILVRARQFQQKGDIDAAIEEFARALELRNSEFGEHHIECAPVYVEYARALLHKAQLADDPFGCKLPDKSKGDSEQSIVTGASGASTSEAGGHQADDDGNEEEDEGAQGEDEGEEDGDNAEEADDLELAFQCLELARLIYEKDPSKQLQLSEVLEYLGEVQMENEVWDEAIKELEASLAIKERVLEAHDRQLAHVHCLVANATMAQIEHRRVQARKHYEEAANVLEKRLCVLGPKAAGQSRGSEAQEDPAGEISELRDLIADIHAKVEEVSAAAASGAEQSSERACRSVSVQGAALPAHAAPSSTTTIGFGNSAATTTIGFDSGNSTPASAPVQNLGVITGRKKAVLEPVCPNPNPPIRETAREGEVCTSMGCAPTIAPVTKRAKVE